MNPEDKVRTPLHFYAGGLAIFLGVKLRKHHDKKKEMESAGSDNNITDDTGSTMQ